MPWLPGMRITADRMTVTSAQSEDATVGRSTSSTTYTDASGGALSAQVVVPQSGVVMVEIRSTQRNPTAGANAITSWQAVGTVSGTVYSPNDAAALINTGTANTSLDLRHRLPGLTPGETLTVTIKHRVNNASSSGIFDYRTVLVEGTS
ncbi:hypothetical protein a10_01837 [Streptomyces acidiscabies]|nr:hypothetical protein a10_01837 [Streptomyces acidiscabies]